MAEPIAVPSSPTTDTLEIWSNQSWSRVSDLTIGRGRKGDETDAVVGTLLNKLGDDRLDHLDAVDTRVIDREIERLHRAGDVEPQNDVDSVRRDFGAVVGTLRPSQSDDHESRRRQSAATKLSHRSDYEYGARRRARD